jgi:hypothetical protein
MGSVSLALDGIAGAQGWILEPQSGAERVRTPVPKLNRSGTD